jgi:hypothetical protein
MGAVRFLLRCLGGLVGIPLLASLARPAAAQPLATYFPAGVPGFGTMPGVTVLSRTRPNYEPAGLREDGFLINPSLEEAVGYDSNVLGGPGAAGSWTLGTHPSVRAVSDWSRDSLGMVLGIDDTRYLDAPRQSRTDGTAAVGGTLAVGRDELTVAAAHLVLHEDRSTLDALPADTPVPFTLDDARLGYTLSLGRLALTPNAELAAYRYDNTTIMGAPASQRYRDRDVVSGGVTARYELMPRLDALLVARGVQTHYVAPQAGEPSRNSSGATVLVGLSDDGDAVWRYRLLVGWEQRQFAASAYPAHNAAIAEGQVIWSPSGLDTVTGTLTRSIEDAAQEGVVGYTYTAATVTLDHEYCRDILLQASTGLQRADFLQGGGRQTALLMGVGVTWLVNRQMRLSATYNFNDQQGGGSGTAGAFNRSVGLVTLRYGW